MSPLVFNSTTAARDIEVNKKRKSKFVGPCVILYLPTSIEPLRFEHRRNRTKRQYYRRRALGSIKNRKTVEKKII